MEVTIKCSPERVLIRVGNEWFEIPEENVPHFALRATVKENLKDDRMVLDYGGVPGHVVYQYRSTWVENMVTHNAWVTAPLSVIMSKPFFIQKRVLFPVGAN